MDWFRWYHGTVNDPKWRTVARRAGVRVADVVAIWATMLEAASANETRGTLTGWCAEDVAVALDLEPEAVQAVYDAMEGKVRVRETLSGWDRRQPKREDLSTDRVRRYREKQRGLSDDATNGNGVKRTETLEESRGEKRRKTSPSVSPPEGETKPKGRRSAKGAAEHPVPDDFRPKESHRAKAAELGLDVDEEAEAFIYHHGAKGTLFANVDLGFFSWLRNAPRFRRTGYGGNGATPAAAAGEAEPAWLAGFERISR